MSHKCLARLALAAALTIPAGAAFAELLGASSKLPAADGLTLDASAGNAVTPKMLANAAPARKISANAGVTFTTDYISRGIQLENQGLIARPYGNLYFTAYEGSGTMGKLTLFGGVWSSLHSEHTGATPGSFVESWYEFDWDVGFAVDLGKFNVNVMYIEFGILHSLSGTMSSSTPRRTGTCSPRRRSSSSPTTRSPSPSGAGPASAESPCSRCSRATTRCSSTPSSMRARSSR